MSLALQAGGVVPPELQAGAQRLSGVHEHLRMQLWEVVQQLHHLQRASWRQAAWWWLRLPTETLACSARSPWQLAFLAEAGQMLGLAGRS